MITDKDFFQKVSCPVCSQEVAYVAINRHLDQDCNTPIDTDEVYIVQEVVKKPNDANETLSRQEVAMKPISKAENVDRVQNGMPISRADNCQEEKKPTSAEGVPSVKLVAVGNLDDAVCVPNDMKKRKSDHMQQPSKRIKRDSDSFR